MTPCMNSRDGQHHFTYSIGSGLKADFEPIAYGETSEDTTYRRVEYSMLACSCGLGRKAKLIVQEDE